MELLPAEPAVAVLKEDDILRRLSPADLLRAALSCHRWCRVASLVLPRAPPLLGYFFHPCATTGSPPLQPGEPPGRLPAPRRPRRRAPLPRRRPRLRHPRRPPRPRPPPPGPAPQEDPPPRPRPRPGLPPPPRDTLPGDRWRRDRYVVGARGALARAHPSRLSFEAVCVTLDEDHQRLGRHRPRRRLHLARPAALRGCRGRLRPLLVRAPLRARRREHLLAHLQLRPHARAEPSHAGFLLPAGAGRAWGLLPQVPHRGGAGGREAVHRGGTGAAAAAMGAWGGQMERQWMADGGGVLPAQGARQCARVAQGHGEPPPVHLAQRHRRWVQREGVHQDIKVRPLFVSSGDWQARASGD